MSNYTKWLLPGVVSYENVDAVSYVLPGAYYEALASLLELTEKGDVVFISGWELHTGQRLAIHSGTGPTVEQLLTMAISRGVKLRVLLDFDQKALEAQLKGHSQPDRAVNNEKAAETIRHLGGEAIVDTQQRLFGSHHQKLVFLTVQGRPHAFCGGVDIASRWGWKDVQVKLSGKATQEVLLTLTERWNSLTGMGSVSRPISAIGTQKSRATNHVQFVRTYGREDWFAKQKGRKYATDGEYGVHSLLSHAVAQTRRFIYIEDQYFFLSEMRTREHIGDLLRKKMAGNPTVILIVVLPRVDQINWEVQQAWYRRRQLIGRITSGIRDAKARVRVFQYRKAASPFVHSKTWIFDDEFAVAGSANFNRRGMTHDGEAAIGITGPGAGPYPFARKLRIQMWLSHLNQSGSGPKFTEGDVSEWPKGLALLESPSSPLERYDPDGGVDSFGKTPGNFEEDLWNAIDPDGS